jgi:hypothetical protein
MVVTLLFLGPDIQQADAGGGEAEHRAGEHVAEQAEFHQVARVAGQVGTEIEHHHVAPRAGHDRRHRRAVDAGQRFEHDFRQREQRPGVAGRNHALGVTRRHRIDRHAHAGAAHAQRGGRLGVVGDDVGRVPHRAYGVRPLALRQQRRQPRLIADEQEAGSRMTFGGDGQPVDHHFGSAVAAHGIHGERVRLAHATGSRRAPGRVAVRLGRRASGRAQPGPPPCRRNARNWRTRDAAASTRRNCCIRCALRATKPRDCGACPAGWARFSASVLP